MRIDGQTRLAAVVAKPIKHSLSPFIHNQAFEMTGVNGVYVAWEIAEQDLADSLVNIRRYKMFGVNVSMPYKEKVIAHLDDVDETAAWIGAVNTVVLDEQRLIGYNTDGLGFWRAAQTIKGFSITGKRLVVLGSGATARAIVAQAVRDGAEVISIVTKEKYLKSTKESLQGLSEHFDGQFFVYPFDDSISLQDDLSRADILVNATALGMDGQSIPIPQSMRLPKHLLVADVIYDPVETPLLAWARQEGLSTLNGLGMLLYQAAEAFSLWTGQAMPTNAIWPALTTHHTNGNEVLCN